MTTIRGAGLFTSAGPSSGAYLGHDTAYWGWLAGSVSIRKDASPAVDADYLTYGSQFDASTQTCQKCPAGAHCSSGR